MKIFFWIQAVFGAFAMLLSSIVELSGGSADPGFTRHTTLLFLISAGFLWTHRAICKLGAKP